MAEFQEGPLRDDNKVPLSKVESRLPYLKPNEFLSLVNEKGAVVAKITGATTGSVESTHYTVRPASYSRAKLRTENEIIVTEAPDIATVYSISPEGVGGHFAPGVSISIEGAIINLPPFYKPDPENALEDDNLLGTSTSDTAILPEVIGICRSGSLHYDEIHAENREGALHAMIDPGGRNYNQDLIGAILPDQGGATLYVLDGNYDAGDVAARIVSTLIVQGVEESSGGIAALKNIGPRFRKIANTEYPQLCGGMGSCAVVADISNGKVTFAHIGDTRGYLLSRDSDGNYQPRHVTKDHSFVQEWLDMGNTIESVPPKCKNMVTRSIHANPGVYDEIEPQISDPIELYPGDLILLMSDGALIVDPKDIIACCNNPENTSPQEILLAVNEKIRAAISLKHESGKRADNNSFLVFQYRGEAT